MSAQQGLFIVPKTPNLPLLTYLADGLQLDAAEAKVPPESPRGAASWDRPSSFEHYALIKLVLPAAAKLDALLDLQAMNVSAASLFPGFDGLCRSMKTRFLRDARSSWASTPPGTARNGSRFG